jgi:hypothetical protein
MTFDGLCERSHRNYYGVACGSAMQSLEAPPSMGFNRNALHRWIGTARSRYWRSLIHWPPNNQGKTKKLVIFHATQLDLYVAAWITKDLLGKQSESITYTPAYNLLQSYFYHTTTNLTGYFSLKKFTKYSNAGNLQGTVKLTNKPIVVKCAVRRTDWNAKQKQVVCLRYAGQRVQYVSVLQKINKNNA